MCTLTLNTLNMTHPNDGIGIVASYGLDGPTSIPGSVIFIFSSHFQTGSGTHPAS
jgi:hypothetical protein